MSRVAEPATTPDAAADQVPPPPPGRQRRRRLRRIALYGALVAFSAFTLLPVVWMVLTAFKSPAEIASVPPTVLPREWRFENFPEALQVAPFGRYLLNSLIMAGSIMALEVSTSALAAYAFARLHFKGRDVLFLLYLATLMVPPQVTLIPQFIIVQQLGWVDTYQGLIIPQAFTAFGTFLLRQFFLTIPTELEDAARVDGASRLTSFFRIILPLSGAALATLAIFSFIFHWNNLLWPLVIAQSDATRPVAVGLREFEGQFGTAWHLLMAASTIALIPIVALYVFTQRWFVKGITMTGFGGR